jgi:hypothetical protein
MSWLLEIYCIFTYFTNLLLYFHFWPRLFCWSLSLSLTSYLIVVSFLFLTSAPFFILPVSSFHLLLSFSYLICLSTHISCLSVLSVLLNFCFIFLTFFPTCFFVSDLFYNILIISFLWRNKLIYESGKNNNLSNLSLASFLTQNIKQSPFLRSSNFNIN